ncbi:MAG: hypothetical protein GY774_25135, partial [Planctomycetes bacterium]|nr:hypothetical protein [Planctomycetota bacterium]
MRFNDSLKEHLNEYLSWKRDISEPIGPSDPLLLSSNTGRHLTTRAIEKAFKRTASKASLSAHYSIHCLRHTFVSYECWNDPIVSELILNCNRWLCRAGMNVYAEDNVWRSGPT